MQYKSEGDLIMKYCEECGHTVLDNQNKCNNCGHITEEIQVKVNNTTYNQYDDTNTESQKNTSYNYILEKQTYIPILFAILSLLSGIISIILFSYKIKNFELLLVDIGSTFVLFTLVTSLIALTRGAKMLLDKDNTSQTLAKVAIIIASIVLTSYFIVGFVLVGKLGKY